MTKKEYIKNRIHELGDSYRRHNTSKSTYDKIIAMECGDWPEFRNNTSFEHTLKLLLECKFTKLEIIAELKNNFLDKNNESRPDRVLSIFSGNNCKNVIRYSKGDIVGLKWDRYKLFDMAGSWVGHENKTLALQLHEEMVEMFSVVGKETGYWGRYFLRSVKRNGGLQTAKRMLSKKLENPSEQKGFRALIEAGRPDLSLENLILQPKFRKLFTLNEINEAKFRLNSLPEYAKRTSISANENHAGEIADEQEYTEGAKKRVTVNAYERDPKARSACLKRHGYACKVCGMNFKAIYGDIGKNFIHVHHKKPLAGRRTSYKVKPTIDLVPVCPNCHAMLHTSNPPLGVEELKKKINNKNYRDPKTPAI